MNYDEPKPKMNKRLLDRVLKHIKTEPRRFFMASFCKPSEAAPCGTQACIGGWALILSKPVPERAKVINDIMHHRVNVLNQLPRLLGLTLDETKSLCLTRVHDSGRRGVRAAERKIELLKSDREKFVERYHY